MEMLITIGVIVLICLVLFWFIREAGPKPSTAQMLRVGVCIGGAIAILIATHRYGYI